MQTKNKTNKKQLQKKSPWENFYLRIFTVEKKIVNYHTRQEIMK